MALFVLEPLVTALRVGHAPQRRLERAATVRMSDPWGASGGFDPSIIAGGAAAVLGLSTGVGLVAFTEKQGVAEKVNNQPCVECKGAKVLSCTICQGSGEDTFASLASEVREAKAETKPSNVIEIEDWATGTQQVVMYEEILAAYPPKVTGPSACLNCEGRGFVVCDNCQGSGIQPKFLERYSPDDFMD